VGRIGPAVADGTEHRIKSPALRLISSTFGISSDRLFTSIG
jgi:hypothetical protein